MRRIAVVLATLILAALAVVGPAAAVVDSTADMDYSESFGYAVDESCSSTSGVVYVIFRDQSGGVPNPPKAKLCGSVTDLRVVPLWDTNATNGDASGGNSTCAQGPWSTYACVGFAGGTWRNANDNISAIRILKMSPSSSCPGGGNRVLRVYKNANYDAHRITIGAVADYNLHSWPDTADQISSIRVECYQ